jgi:Uma2 family endonuclease
MVTLDEVGIGRRLFTLDEYHRLGEAGILTADDRVELIEGEIVQMPPIGSDHASVVDILNVFFTRGLDPATGQVRIQNPITLKGRSEVQPDLVVALPRQDRYRSHNPAADEVLLAIEVADSTLRFDRQVKLPLYASASVPEVWIVNLVARTIDVFRKPNEAGYGETQTLKRGESVAPSAFPELTVAVNDILG